MLLLDALVAQLRLQARHSESEAPPVAVLWTDEEFDWLPLIQQMQTVLPELYCLGKYEPGARTGPAIWLRCVVDRTIPEGSPPAEVIPILYLPGVRRQELRAGHSCRLDWQPLIELQFRGVLWHQKNGRDWTVESFLAIEPLGLEIRSNDPSTREALRTALSVLATHPIEGFRGKVLDADDFYELTSPDPKRELLLWLNNPESLRQKKTSERKSFVQQCIQKFHFDPEKDSPLEAAERLLQGDAEWEGIWQRFIESPPLYSGFLRWLQQADANLDHRSTSGTRRPGSKRTAASQGPVSLFYRPDRSPAANEQAERDLLQELEAAANLSHTEAVTRIFELDKQHAPRRDSVWSRLGQAPLANALALLAELAQRSTRPLTGTRIEDMVAAYQAEGWRCDRAAMQAMASVGIKAHARVVRKVVCALYAPWLDQAARTWQNLLAKNGDWAKLVKLTHPVQPPQENTCIVFADGLRMDVGRSLQVQLEARGARVEFAHRLAPIPSVTPTAKPAASPLTGLMKGIDSGAGFCPSWKSSGQLVTAPRFREDLRANGIQVFDHNDPSAPSSSGGGWTESGNIDKFGHEQQADLASLLESEVEKLAQFVWELFELGWHRIRIVTDHGWLLLPGGLPKIELPASTVETKWTRCAEVKGASEVSVPVHPWHWNELVRIASPPGIGSFRASTEYSHGGLSPQEMVVPDMLISRGMEAVNATIVQIHWRGMRCKIRVKTNDPRLRVDVRLNANRAETSLAISKEVGTTGEVSLAVRDELEGHPIDVGHSVTVVVIDSEGRILAKQNTNVGEEE
jgi:hypothetical protein